MTAKHAAALAQWDQELEGCKQTMAQIIKERGQDAIFEELATNTKKLKKLNGMAELVAKIGFVIAMQWTLESGHAD